MRSFSPYFDDGTESILGRCVAAQMVAYAKAAGLSQAEAAIVVGLSQSGWSMRTRNKRCFTLDHVAALCLHLEMNPAEFITSAYQQFQDIVVMSN